MPNAEGLYTKEEHEAGIKTAIESKSAALRNLNAEKETLTARIAELEPLAKTAHQAVVELAASRLSIHDAKDARRLFGTYQADVADLPENRRPSYSDWLASDDGKSVVARYAPPPAPVVAAAPAPAPAAPAAPPAAAPAVAAPVPAPVAPPAPGPAAAPAPPPLVRPAISTALSRREELMAQRARATGAEREKISAQIRELSAQVDSPPSA